MKELRLRRAMVSGAVLALGIAIGAVGKSAYRGLQAPSVDIHDMKVAVHQGLRDHVDVVMLGDSLTHWGEWAEMLPGLRVANGGIAGDVISQVRSRLATVDQLSPETTVLTIGTKYLWRGRSVPEAAADHSALVDELRTRPGRLIVLAVPRAGTC